MRKLHQKKRAKTPVSRRQTSVSVSEESRTFTVVVPGDCQPRRVRIDAEPYIRILKRRCDYAIEVFHDPPKQVFFFVELKGGDVLKAVEQLAYTAEHLNDYKHLIDYRPFAIRHACIVASQGLKPSITTRYQVWQARLTKCDFARVKVRTRQLTALVDEGGKVSYA